MNSAVLTAIVVVACLFLITFAMFFSSFIMNTRDPSTNEFEDAEQEEYLRQYAANRKAKMNQRKHK